MGLLDALNSDEGLFGLSLLAAAAPRAGGRVSIGEGLLGASQAVAQRRAQMEDRALKQQLIQAQIQDAQAQAEQRQAAAQQLQRQAAEKQRIQELLRSAAMGPQAIDANAISGISGPRPEALQALQSAPAINYQRLIAEGVPPELVKGFAEATNLGRSEVARTIEGKDAQGRPVTLQLDRFGKPIGEAVPQWKAPIQADTGGAINFIDPTTLAALSSLKKTNTPDALLSANTTMRGQNMVDARSREANAAARSELGKPPPGFRWKADGSLEAIPGGPADIKAGELGAKAEQRKAMAEQGALSVLGTVGEAKSLVGMNTAGVGSWMASIPATDARNLAAKLETIKANLGFDRLQQMREASPTGGALGAVAVQELTALQSTVSSLDQAQSPAQLRKSLDKIERHYSNWLKTVSPNAGGASGTWDKQGGSAPSLDDLLKKYGGN